MPGHAAGDQFAQHGVEPADDLSPGAAQVAVPLGPYLQHRCVVIGPGLPHARRAQRCDSHRPGIVRVVLVHVASPQQPDPRTQLGLHVQHPLTRRQQLLGQQVPRAAGALDRPGPLGPRLRPLQQPSGLRGRGTHPQLPQDGLVRADYHRGMRALMRIHPDHHCHRRTPYVSPGHGKEPRRARLIPKELASARASFEPRHGEAPAASTSFESQAQQPGPAGGSRASPPGPLNATARLTAIPAGGGPQRLTASLNQAGRGAPGASSALTVRAGMLIEPRRIALTCLDREIRSKSSRRAIRTP
jgi:hypothetical protein